MTRTTRGWSGRWRRNSAHSRPTPALSGPARSCAGRGLPVYARRGTDERREQANGTSRRLRAIPQRAPPNGVRAARPEGWCARIVPTVTTFRPSPTKECDHVRSDRAQRRFVHPGGPLTAGPAVTAAGPEHEEGTLRTASPGCSPMRAAPVSLDPPSWPMVDLGRSELHVLYHGLESGSPLISEMRRRGRDVILSGFEERGVSILDNARAAEAAVMRAGGAQPGDAPLVVGGSQTDLRHEEVCLVPPGRRGRAPRRRGAGLPVREHRRDRPGRQRTGRVPPFVHDHRPHGDHRRAPYVAPGAAPRLTARRATGAGRPPPSRTAGSATRVARRTPAAPT